MSRSLRKKNRAQGLGRVPADFLPPGSALSALASSWRKWLLRFLLIASMTVWIYGPSLRGELIWDDQWYITLNPTLHGWDGLWKFWLQPGSWVEYYPLEETVLWIQWHLWGDNTLGYHLTNVFLHLVSALLVWRLLSKFGLSLAWLGGLIFAIHPVQVESVAYICELKNALSGPFFLLAMIAWIDYEESKSKKNYQGALILYLVGMLCKISLAPFAAVILLYAWWKRGRIGWSDVKACAPFLLIALVLVFANVWAGAVYEKVGHVVIPDTPLDGVFSRLAAAGQIVSVYFARCFLPVDVLYIYPQWPLHPESPLAYLPWLILAAVAGILWTKRESWGRHVLLGLGFFLLVISPFLGLTSISYMNFIWVMDHFLYLPIIGLIGLVVAGLGDLSVRVPSGVRLLGTGIIACAIGLMCWVSYGFSSLFQNEETLWTHILKRNPAVWLAHDNLGCKLMEEERYDEAMAEERTAILLRPDTWDSYYNLGFALQKVGRDQEAEVQYHKALTRNRDNPKIYLNLGETHRRAGDLAGAESEFRQGLKIAPEDASLSTDLAGILMQTGRFPEAISLYEQVISFNPDYAQIHYNLGIALLQVGNFAGAAEHLQAALDIDPTNAAAHENLGVAFAQSGRYPEAIDQFEAVLQLNPNSWQALDNLGLALAQTGQIQQAIAKFERALEVNPQDAKARGSLDKLKLFEQQQGRR